MQSRFHFLLRRSRIADALAQFTHEVRCQLPSSGWYISARRQIWPILLFLPTLFSAVYLLFMASDQYEAEAKFIVRSAQRPDAGPLTFLIQLGLQRSQDDAFIVQDYMASRDAVRSLQERLPLRDMFETSAIDFLAGYPSILYGRGEERFYKYFQTMISISHTDKTGISTLKVRAFSAENARRIADTLLQLGEALVNRVNDRLLRDAVGRAEAEVALAQKRVVEAQADLTEFRNRELLIDPKRNAIALAELIAKLSAELAATRAQIAEAKMSAASGPQISILERKAMALDEQIGSERARVVRSSDGLAQRVATYERLTLEKEFANRMLTTNEADLVRSRAEAVRQLLYLERVVTPHLSDYPAWPKRWRGILTVLAANLLAVLIGWLLFTGIREHGSQR